MLRVIKEVKPSWVVGENVRGLVGWNGGLVFEEVCADLESQGYEVQPILIPAASVNAPHKRDRIWFIAHSNHKGKCSQSEYVSKENGEVSQWDNNAKPSNTDSLNASNPNDKGLQGVELNGTFDQGYRTSKPYQSTTQLHKIKNWEQFPTQSPLCGGDDGIPRTLDSISFPKWRNESIKAYGNAIVPQVALQIFKVINKMR